MVGCLCEGLLLQYQLASFVFGYLTGSVTLILDRIHMWSSNAGPCAISFAHLTAKDVAALVTPVLLFCQVSLRAGGFMEVVAALGQLMAILGGDHVIFLLLA